MKKVREGKREENRRRHAVGGRGGGGDWGRGGRRGVKGSFKFFTVKTVREGKKREEGEEGGGGRGEERGKEGGRGGQRVIHKLLQSVLLANFFSFCLYTTSQGVIHIHYQSRGHPYRLPVEGSSINCCSQCYWRNQI